MTKAELIKALNRERFEEGLTHEAFAQDRLKIDPATWWRIRNGRQEIGIDTMKALAVAYPKLYNQFVEGMGVQARAVG